MGNRIRLWILFVWISGVVGCAHYTSDWKRLPGHDYRYRDEPARLTEKTDEELIKQGYYKIGEATLELVSGSLPTEPFIAEATLIGGELVRIPREGVESSAYVSVSYQEHDVLAGDRMLCGGAGCGIATRTGAEKEWQNRSHRVGTQYYRADVFRRLTPEELGRHERKLKAFVAKQERRFRQRIAWCKQGYIDHCTKAISLVDSATDPQTGDPVFYLESALLKKYPHDYVFAKRQHCHNALMAKRRIGWGYGTCSRFLAMAYKKLGQHELALRGYAQGCRYAVNRESQSHACKRRDQYLRKIRESLSARVISAVLEQSDRFDPDVVAGLWMGCWFMDRRSSKVGQWVAGFQKSTYLCFSRVGEAYQDNGHTALALESYRLACDWATTGEILPCSRRNGFVKQMRPKIGANGIEKLKGAVVTERRLFEAMVESASNR